MCDAVKHLLNNFQIRKSKKQKADFRDWLSDVLSKAGYEPTTETGGGIIKSCNVVVGDPGKSSVIFTAHYDTCAVLPFPNFITPRNILFYLLYQLAIVIPMFVLAIAAETLLLVCWDDCPLWLAMLVVYLVLGFFIWWMLAGPANKHTANDNTSGVATLLEIALSLPIEDRKKVAFVFFDNEEIGLLGSSAFKKAHGSAVSNKLLINFDCVSDGEYIHLYPNKQVKQNQNITNDLNTSFQPSETRNVEIIQGFGFYPSDQRNFPLGVGVAALHKSRFGYWLGRIHTNRDTVYQAENVELLRKGALHLISII